MTLLPLGLKGHWPSLPWPHLEFWTPARLPWPRRAAWPGRLAGSLQCRRAAWLGRREGRGRRSQGGRRRRALQGARGRRRRAPISRNARAGPRASLLSRAAASLAREAKRRRDAYVNRLEQKGNTVNTRNTCVLVLKMRLKWKKCHVFRSANVSSPILAKQMLGVLF